MGAIPPFTVYVYLINDKQQSVAESGFYGHIFWDKKGYAIFREKPPSNTALKINTKFIGLNCQMFKKIVTTVSGFDDKEKAKELEKLLKKKLLII